MSGAQTSTFADPNILYKALSGAGTAEVQRNQLMNQQTQQGISAADIAMTGQAAASLLNMSEPDAAAAYGPMIQSLQAQGFAKNAPAQYPGHAASQALVQRALSLPEQYQFGLITSPGLADALKAAGAPLPGQGGAAAPAARGASVPAAGSGDFGSNLAQAESGGRPGVINDLGYTGMYQFGKQRLADLGYYTPAPGEDMNNNRTWAGRVSVPGFNVTDQQSFANNPAAQRVAFATHIGNIDQAIDSTPGADRFDRNGLRAVAHLGGTDGMQKFIASGGLYNPGDANGTRLSAYYTRFSGGAPGGGGPATVATAGAPVVIGDSLASPGGLGGSGMVGAQPSAVRAQVASDAQRGAYRGQDVVLSSGASNAPGDLTNVEGQLQALQGGGAGKVSLVGVGPAVEAKAPGTNGKLQALAQKYGATFVPLPADQMSPDGVHPTAQGYATLKAAVVPPAAAPGGVAARTGGTDLAGPGAPSSAVPGAPAPAAAPSPAQPAAATGTGTQSPQFQAALELNRRAQAIELAAPASPQAKAMAASLRAQAALYMQADAVSVDPVTGIQTKQLTGERLNAAAPNAHYVWNDQQGAYVDTTGTHPPVTPPSPRLTTTPGGAVLQSKPGGGATVVYQTPPADITTQEAAKTSGAAAGTATGKLTATLADQGRTSAQAIGNIDYGMSQLEKAKAGGINTGYFAPWLGTVSAIGKSLGIPPELIGVNPAAVGNIQTAQKTLAVVSGAILQQVLGPDSQITDAKLSHFIHAQPGIETDPDAVGRVLNWARSQFVYEREMAAQGMKDASQTGVLPTNWEANYYDKHGFAPIYNPGTGEMQQPDGGAPSREPPAATKTAPVNPAARTAGTTYQTPKGPMKWTGTGWLPAQ